MTRITKYLAGAAATAAVLGATTAAHASLIPVLQSVTPSGANWLYTYQVTLDGDQGLTKGSTLAIYDFEGYVAGSLTAPAGWTTSTPLTSGAPLLSNPVGDNAGIVNLQITWNGEDYRTSGGEYPATQYTITALSSLNTVKLDGYSAMAIKNNGTGTGTTAWNIGQVEVPAGVPEPATWAMMILGMGMVGFGLRMRRRQAGALA